MKTISRIALGLTLILLLGNNGFATVITSQEDLRQVSNPQNQTVSVVESAALENTVPPGP